MINKNLVVLSYGRESEYYRAIFSVLSFFAWTKHQKIDQVNILIYTDKPSFFQQYLKDFNIEYFTLTDSILMEMMGGSDYIHRRKVGVIDLTFKAFPERDVLFVDSDTFFIDETDDLLDGFAAGKSFMHKREYTFEEGHSLFKSFNQGEHPERFINYITDRDFVIDGAIEKFNKYDYSWNSGVLGLDKNFVQYMPDVYKLTDDFYKNSHWFISEQLAFALILQKRTEIIPTENTVLHYWGKRQKELFDSSIKEFLDNKSFNFNDRFFIRTLTKKLKNKIEMDLAAEKAVVAFSQGQLKHGIRRSIQLLTHFPTDINIYKEVLAAVVKRSILLCLIFSSIIERHSQEVYPLFFS